MTHPQEQISEWIEHDIPADIIEAAREAAAITWGQDGCIELAREFRSGMRDDSGSVQTAVAALVADRQRDQWQDISTAPKDGTTVLLFAPGWDSPNTGWRFTEDAWQDCPYSHRGDGSYEPTHWQPLPAAPKGEA